MMFPPKPFKFVCPKCGYTIVVKHPYNALDIVAIQDTCPKCGTTMEGKALNIIVKIFR